MANTVSTPGVIMSSPVMTGRYGRFDVVVPTEDGRKCAVDVVWDSQYDTYEFKVSGELLEQAPQAVTAVLQLTVRAIAAERETP